MSEPTMEEIEAALEAATPGPWEQRPDTPWGSKVLFNASGEFYVGVSALTPVPNEGWSSEARERARELGRYKCADAHLIANAPTYLAFLLEHLEVRNEYASRQADARINAEARVSELEKALREIALWCDVGNEPGMEWVVERVALLVPVPAQKGEG